MLNPFSLELSSLPREIPIFDLSGTVLLPRAHLPLTIEDNNFKALVDGVLKRDRLVGIVQKRPHEQSANKIFQSGCLGRITTFTEAEPGKYPSKYLIIISGLIRFGVVKELRRKNGYRRVKVSYDPFFSDLVGEEQVFLERENLVSLLKKYLNLQGISANWEEINEASDDRLITSLTMACPFEPQEKQALLESQTLIDRCRMMTALIEMAFLRGSGTSWVKH
jgi:Lon protease-like protein